MVKPGFFYNGRARAPSPGRRRRALAAVWVALAATLVATLTAGVVAAREGAQPGAIIVELSVLPGVDRARVEIVSVGRIAPQVYQIAGPDRLVIDARDVAFRLPRQVAIVGGGLVRDVRYGQLEEGRSRIVADVGPGTTVAAVTNEHVRGRLHRLVVDLGVKGGAGGEVINAAMVGPGAGGAAAARRPVVVIDPGHGGIDPGAVVNRRQLEKLIVLAVGKKVQAHLEAAGEVDVVLTRDRDVYLTLDQRIERARQARADLFLSLHADSVDEDTPVMAAGGASIYILSKRASDQEARRLAEKENAADRFAGILPKPAEDDGVRSILVDLLKRETEAESVRLRSLLVVEMQRDVAMAHKPARSAAFHVLKQTETPAALIELGYMTNPVDLGLMRQESWRERIAEAIARAVHRFFRERG